MTQPAPFVVPPPPYELAGSAPEPTFSVVIPAFDAAGLIEDALESVFAQTRPPDEVIVSDDGSTDDLARALAPFRDRVVVVQGENAGPGAARNRAARTAGGDFLVNLDADDLFLPERLARLADLARAHPSLDVLATDAFVEGADGTSFRFNEATPFSRESQRTDIFERCFVVSPAVRRSRLLALGGFDESLATGEDWELLIRLVLAGSAIGLIAEPLYRYRLRPDSATSSRLDALRTRVRILESFAVHPGLSTSEREALERAIARRRHALLRAQAEVALTSGTSGARLAALKLALSPAASARERIAAAGWAAIPRLGRRRLVRLAPEARVSASPWERSRRRP